MEQYEVRPLSPSLLDDYLAFFDRDAFQDNPHWASCYCYFYNAPQQGEEWDLRTAQENRAAVSGLIGTGGMHGYLAYQGGRPVGWCHAAPRFTIRNLANYPNPDALDPAQVGSIVCFVVAQPRRRSGVATVLLEAALQGFAEQGLTWAEAYPRNDPGAQSTPAANYHGFLQMYLKHGFEVVHQLEHICLVRKRL